MTHGRSTSGVFQVASNFAANSGVSVYDALNYGGQYAYFDIVAANSSVFTAYLVGEPLR